ncbi:MAG: hypothetical protein WC412_04690 [Candidatus Omnitrophota bacterium]|jgi:hypothetical protein
MDRLTSVLPKRCVVRKNIYQKLAVKRLNRNAGFSLVEVIVATCIFLMLVDMAFVTLNTGMNSWFTGNIAVEMRSELIKTLSVMEKELKETAPAQTNLPSGALAASINFHLPGGVDVDGDGTIIYWSGTAPLYEPAIEWSAEVITYELNAAGEIIRRTSLGQSRVLARNISSLQFSRPSVASNILQIDITAQKQDSKGRIVNDAARLMVKMRNS